MALTPAQIEGTIEETLDDLCGEGETFTPIETDSSGRFKMKVESAGKSMGFVWIHPNDSLSALKQRIEDRITGSGSEVDLTPSGLTAKHDSDKLSKHGFPKGHNDANKVQILFKADGGAAVRRKRRINFERFPNLKQAPSSAKDCMLMCRISDEAYALLPCGCAVSADTMYRWMRAIYRKSLSAYQIKCPHHKVEWDFDTCAQICNMGDKEYKMWSTMRDQRRLKDYRACPHCKSLCKKSDGVNIQRVRCRQCSNPDWCWTCSQQWNHSGLLICGNKNCKLVQDLTNTLQKCEPISLKYINVECPSIRACPRCWTLMKWKSGCKHMKCFGCGKRFCFQCLALERDSSPYWPCSDHNHECGQAPRQNFMK